MGHPTKALSFCLLFVVAAELTARFVPGPPLEQPPPGVTSPMLVLGTSRSLRALVPDVIDEELRRAGHWQAWSANLSTFALTTVGLYQRYMEKVHPWAHAERRGGVLAIEVRGSGMNDSYLTDDEERFLASAPAAELLQAPGSGRGALAALRELDFDGAADALFWKVRLFRANPSNALVRRWLRPAGGEEQRPQEPQWTLGSRGWFPFPEPPHADLREAHWRKLYQERLLRRYRIGEIQSRALTQLVRQARADGFVPVLYIMPITELHRSFFAPGDYDAFLAELRRVSEREQVRLVDFDSPREFSVEQFHDSHHLRLDAAEPMSRAFATRVFLPELERD